MKPIEPFLVILLVSTFILLLGFVVFRAACRRPRTACVLIGLVMAAGFGTLAYVAVAAEADVAAGRWLAVGLGLVVLSCPAWVLVPPTKARTDGSLNRVSLADVAKLLFGYLAACWLIGLAVAIFVHLIASPPGSLR